jgi:serine/threonine protein kinase
LICGSLPFDEENIPELVKKIKKAAYRMPNFVSNDAKDLITRILKVNPLERLTIPEIK